VKIVVEAIAAPSCSRCAEAREALKSVAEAIDRERIVWRDVNLLEAMDYAVELGVVSPPSIAIDGKLVFPVLPTPKQLREELVRRLDRAGAGSS
jgi:thioredoxin 1